jgi:hypothetical protein
VCCELFEPCAPTEHLAAHPASWLCRCRAAALAHGSAPPGAPPPFTLCVNFMNPGAVARARSNCTNAHNAQNTRATSLRLFRPHLHPFRTPSFSGSPGRVPYTSLCLCFQAPDRCGAAALLSRPTPLARVLRRFLAADVATRAGMLKIIADVQDGPLLLRAAAPRTPVLIGRHLRTAVHAPRDGSYVEARCASRAHAPRGFSSVLLCVRVRVDAWR